MVVVSESWLQEIEIQGMFLMNWKGKLATNFSVEFN